MSLPGSKSEVLPFTLTEIFVLLLFLLLLVFVGGDDGPGDVVITEECSGEVQPGQECRLYLGPPGFDSIPWINLRPCAEAGPGEKCMPIDSTKVPQLVACAEEVGPGEECIPIDSTKVGQLEDCAEEVGPGEDCIPIDSTKVPQVVACAEEVAPGERCMPIDSTEIVVDGSWRPVILSGLSPDSILTEIQNVNTEIGPCWREQPTLSRPRGAVVYVFDVDMSPDTTFTFTPLDLPNIFQAAVSADTVPGVLELSAAGTVDRETYTRIGRTIRDWSDRQTPSCRLYVRIFFDEVEFAGQSPLLAIGLTRIVEDYFYKDPTIRTRSRNQ